MGCCCCCQDRDAKIAEQLQGQNEVYRQQLAVLRSSERALKRQIDDMLMIQPDLPKRVQVFRRDRRRRWPGLTDRPKPWYR